MPAPREPWVSACPLPTTARARAVATSTAVFRTTVAKPVVRSTLATSTAAARKVAAHLALPTPVFFASAMRFNAATNSAVDSSGSSSPPRALEPVPPPLLLGGFTLADRWDMRMSQIWCFAMRAHGCVQIWAATLLPLPPRAAATTVEL